MNILFASSEAVPFAKTGGLADVSAALPKTLAEQGHNVTLIIPGYLDAFSSGIPYEILDITYSIKLGEKTVHGGFARATLPGSKVDVLLVAQNDYFDREGLYNDSQNLDYNDNCERFVFFSRAVLEAIRLLNLDIDVLHSNDWQTGLVPAYLDLLYRPAYPIYEKIASLHTLHNLAYQGQFWHWDMPLTGLEWDHFNWQELEFHGKLNFLKTAVVYADALSTVSPTYADEICTHAGGKGLDCVLMRRRDDLYGILNGVDYSEWNPATDDYIPHQYDIDSFVEGKNACKKELQMELGLPVDPSIPMIGFVGRFSEQKGIHLLNEIMTRSTYEMEPVQWVILGTGDKHYEYHLSEFAEKEPNCSVWIGFDEALAHKINAASDAIVMPSIFEPCGLSQLYALKYGAPPLVRAVGGLQDTINAENGFKFHQISGSAMFDEFQNLIATYRDTERWHALVRTGMQQDWSWDNRAKQYVELYEKIAEKKRSEEILGE